MKEKLGWDCVCVGRQQFFITLCTASLSHKRIPSELHPFEIPQACLVMSTTRVFKGLHLCSFLSWIPLLASKEFSASSWHTHTHMLACTHPQACPHARVPYFPTVKIGISLFLPWQYTECWYLLHYSVFNHFNHPLGLMVKLIRSTENIVVRTGRAVTRKKLRVDWYPEDWTF